MSHSLRPHGLNPPGSSVMGFSRQQYWSGLSFPFPGDLSDSRIKLSSPALQADPLPSEPPGKVLSFTATTHVVEIDSVPQGPDKSLLDLL